jgi:hypothetical protein
MSKYGGMQQGKEKNSRTYVQALGVKHFIRSTLPYVIKLTDRMLKGVGNCDSKAGVELYIQSMKGDMIATYFMPDSYMQNIKGMIKVG